MITVEEFYIFHADCIIDINDDCHSIFMVETVENHSTGAGFLNHPQLVQSGCRY